MRTTGEAAPSSRGSMASEKAADRVSRREGLAGAARGSGSRWEVVRLEMRSEMISGLAPGLGRAKEGPFFARELSERW